jgi:ABC-type sulfate transport system substrate-binding protein
MMPRMLDNWSRQTEEELMELKRKGTPSAIQAFADALVEAEKQYLFKNPKDSGVKINTMVYMSKEDRENGY